MNRRTVLSLVALISITMAVLGCGISCRTSTVDTKTVLVNTTIRQMKADGRLKALHEKYGLQYAF